MLQDIRDNSQGVISKVIIGVIIAVFALTGASYLIDRLPITSVAEVNGEEITEAQLLAETQQFLNSMRADKDERLACQCRIFGTITIEVEYY